MDRTVKKPRTVRTRRTVDKSDITELFLATDKVVEKRRTH